MRVQLAGVGKHHGAQVILDQVTLTIGDGARIGLVGPNGVGKTTLLRIVAGHEAPDTGTVTRAPERATVGYLAQERVRERDMSILGWLSRQAGIDQAERELEESAHALAAGEAADDRYAAALDRLVALGAGTFAARARSTCAELGLGVDLDRSLDGLSGGETSRVALAAILLSRFDLLLLDEPTNDLDYDGLERLERFLGSYRGALVVVSHDREFLDRTVRRIASIEADTHRVREWAGGFSDYEVARDAERAAALAEYEHARLRRKDLARLLSTRRTEARGKGAALGDKTGGQDRRATHALQTKVRQAERLLQRNELPPKPFEPWELELTLPAAERSSDVVVQLAGAVAQRGLFRLGPVDLDLAPRERLSIAGPNGAGKSTLLGLLLDGTGLVAGRRVVGRRTVVGAIGQERDAYSGGTPLVEELTSRSGLARVEARTLLAKFGLRADHIGRPCSSLSPGERTRAHLAELQARGVNLLVLDEPTNHLDLDAVEQLESALVEYDGTLVVVSHDRRFLERIAPTRELALPRR
ncbi:MAG TPA: ABC-F family ATP-binding cassette domain-containing protein [Gaiellaceae bacterium]|nr:ABC-F family ATP-binding cassette domain-containing protein [Gaiellaceae bacterium]